MAPERIFMSVLLPAPFSPINAITSPGATLNSTPRNALVAPKLRRTPRISRRKFVVVILRNAAPGLLQPHKLPDFRIVRQLLLRYEHGSCVDRRRDLFL